MLLYIIGTILAVYSFIAVFLTIKINKLTETQSKYTGIIYRTIFYTMFWGISPIGGEGFALPGPIFIAIPTAVASGMSELIRVVLMVTLSWVALLFVCQLLFEKLKLTLLSR